MKFGHTLKGKYPYVIVMYVDGIYLKRNWGGEYENVSILVTIAAKIFKGIHAQESKTAALKKAKAVIEELETMKLKEAAKKLEDGIEIGNTQYHYLIY